MPLNKVQCKKKVEDGEIEKLKEDILKQERSRLGREAEKEKKKGSVSQIDTSTNQVDTSISQVGAEKKKTDPLCKICGSKGDHWAFDEQATKVTCPAYNKSPKDYDKAKAEAALAARKELVDNYNKKNAARAAAAGGGPGRPSPKKD